MRMTEIMKELCVGTILVLLCVPAGCAKAEIAITGKQTLHSQTVTVPPHKSYLFSFILYQPSAVSGEFKVQSTQKVFAHLLTEEHKRKISQGAQPESIDCVDRASGTNGTALGSMQEGLGYFSITNQGDEAVDVWCRVVVSALSR
jgi:hypothetical protein